MAATWLIPIAVPLRAGGKTSVRMAVEFASTIAAPAPCTTRQPMSHSAPDPPEAGSSVKAIAATVNTAKPTE